MKQKLFIVPLCSLLLLTGCWDNLELDDSVLVHGVGMDIDESSNKIRTIVEIIKPTSGPEGQSGGQESGQNIVLEKKDDTLLEAARSFIRYAKRRLNFSHSMVWIIGNDLAKEEDFVHALDTLRRDQMLRLNSFLFISAENHDPGTVLNTPTLYEELTSTELVSALEQSQFNMDYAPIKLREFYTLIEEPINSAYVPIIKAEQVGEQIVTAIDGTAVIRDNKMVGKLTSNETIGLQWLLNRVQGGTVSVSLEEKQKVGIEITNAHTTIMPQLESGQLIGDVHIEVEGTLADNMTDRKINEAFFKEAEEKISEDIQYTVQRTINKLQNDIKADITGIGAKTYQQYPKQWRGVADNWHDGVFPNADISVHVDTNFTHQGLINESIEQDRKKPNNNPYQFKE